MLKFLAIFFGLLMVAVGILGFLPDYAPGGKLFGIFSVNPMHNVIHVVTGIAALVCGLASSMASKVFFILFGLIYAAVAVLGFIQGEGNLYGMIAINQADNWLHTGIALASLYFGLFLKSK
jgi:hypothetical protein